MTDMTEEQAQAEARRRWGAGGTIKFRPAPEKRSGRGRLARYPCVVGNGIPRSFEAVEGQGYTWREAFADARSR
jgi:hypothetical protein